MTAKNTPPKPGLAPFAWEVTFYAPGDSMTVTMPRRTPGEAVSAVWVELSCIKDGAAFLAKVTRMTVRKVVI